MYHLYGEITEQDMIDPKFVITEDSNSGCDFYTELSKQKNIKCITANGKSDSK